uniref:Secreted protein n=1 Tax=Ascaris lumbricoides TaxID=6252 RepID=A0A0M3HSX0_ASCLU
MQVLLFCGTLSVATAFHDFVINTDVRTGERRFRDLTVITAPDEIGRVRLLLSTAKAMHSFLSNGTLAYSEAGKSSGGLLRLSFSAQLRAARLKFCSKRILIDMRVDWSFNGYDEKFRLPDRDLLLRCRVSAVNTETIRSRWTNSRAVFITRTR